MADTLAFVWPRTGDDPLRGCVVDGAGAVRSPFEISAPLTGDGLKAALSKAKIGAKRAVVALPRSRATVRHLDLPAVSDDDLPDLVRMQAATKSAAPLDQLALDFLPLPLPTGEGANLGRAALLAMIPSKLLAEVQGTMSAAGLELATVGLNPVGFARMVATRELAAGNSLVVSRDGEFAELTLLSVGPEGARVTHTHSAHPSAESDAQWERSLLSECSRVLVSHGSVQTDGLTSVWALGKGADRLAPQLVERFGGTPHPATGWEPLGASGDSALADPGRFGGAVGLAIGAETTPGINFLAPRRRPAPKDTRLRTGLLAATVLTVLVGAGWFVLDRQKSNLRETIAGLDAQIAADDALVERNEPLLIEDAALSEWSGEATDSRAELARLDLLLPGTDRLFLENFQLTPPTSRNRATVRADGFAESADLVRLVERDLAAAGYVVRPTQTSNVTGRAGYPVKFSLSAELPPTVPGDAATTNGEAAT
ncbi:hypothetical protein [Alienimonas chondri]|uniref:Uncharacterized protein n=1 Tax=Alienimonas chondri TaxID=2681879 RepID=A0ABX1VDD4_9PLAN|nr:hypothetical protein [Alienimonas chondri]NNJ25714.1 hypothetical protein [Alienimonas chondri]